MPTFGDYETVGEPVAITDEGGRVSTVWQAKKQGGRENQLYAIKCFTPQGRPARPEAESADAPLEADPRLEFLDSVKQLKKARSEGGRCLAPIHDFGIADDGAWYATDFYKRTLKSWIALRGVVDDAALRHVVYSIVAGCRSIKRSCGRSHGNVKVGNMFLAGKPQAFRKTPLELIDLRPASMIHAYQRGSGGPAPGADQISQITEIHDLHAIGLIILQLVQGRIVRNEHDYNYPIQPAPEWGKLGKEGERWRKLCNDLLDPNLSMEDISLDSLAKQFRPNELGAKLPLILGGVAVVCALGAGIYFAIPGTDKKFQAHFQAAQNALDATNFTLARRELDNALQYKPQDPAATDFKAKIAERFEQERKQALAMAGQEFRAKNWDGALAWAKHASELDPSDQEAVALLEKIQHEQTYQTAITAAGNAIRSEDYNGAIQHANDALKARPGDVSANAILTQANNSLKLAACDAEIKKAQTALDGGDYAEAVAHAKAALAIRPDDAKAAGLVRDAQARLGASATQRENAQRYDRAMKAAREAWDRRDYPAVLDQTGTALVVQPNDSAAIALRDGARSQLDNDRKYLQTMALAQTSFDQKDYAGAITQANTALAIRPGDSAATRLRNNAQTQQGALEGRAASERRYKQALADGQTAYGRQDYEAAITQANAALAIKADDSPATTLKNNAQTRLDEERKYKQAIADGQAAYGRQDYAGALTQANAALAIRPGDSTATKLRSDAQAQQGVIEGRAASERKYKQAIADSQAAYDRQDYAGAITQANAALAIKADDSPATTLKNNAQTRLDNERKYKQAIADGQAAYVRRDYAGALTQANAALVIRPGDSTATGLKNSAQTGLDGEHKYQQAMTDGQAAYDRHDYNGALTQAKAALAIKPDDSAATALRNNVQALLDGDLKYNQGMSAAQAALGHKDYTEVIAQADAALGIRNNDPAASKLKTQATDAKSLQEAQADFDKGDYNAARQICDAHKGASDFDTLAASIGAEQTAIDNARNSPTDISYSLIDKLKDQSYSQKPPFTALFAQEKTERENLAELQTLKTGNQWQAVRTKLAGLGPNGFLRGQPFDGLRAWADGRAQAEEQQLKGWDNDFQILLVRYNVLKPGKATSPDAKKERAYPRDGVPQQTKDDDAKRVTSLTSLYQQGGWLDKPGDWDKKSRRQDLLGALKNSIDSY